MKIIKWSLIIFLSLIILLVGYFTLIFNVNDFKPRIEDAFKQQTGRQLVIKQDLNLTIFPSIGVSFGDITISNPEGFKHKTMLKVKKMVAEVALMPLFSKKIEIAKLNIDGLILNIDSYKNGRNSFNGLVGGKKPVQSKQVDKKESNTDASKPSSSSSDSLQLASLNVGGVAITNTHIQMFDQATGKTQTFNLDNFTLGQFSLGKLADFSYHFSAALPDMALKSEGSGKLKLTSDLQQLSIKNFAITNQLNGAAIPNQQMSVVLMMQLGLNLKDKKVSAQLDKFVVDNIDASGTFDVNYAHKIPKIIASLKLGAIDLDALLPKDIKETVKNDAKPDESNVKSAKKTEVATAKQQEPDLSGLKNIDLTADLQVKSVKVNNIETSNWLMKLTLKNGLLNLNQLSADLYKGKFTTTAQLDTRGKMAHYRFDSKVSNVQVRPLLIAAAKIKLLAGAANFSITGEGKSLITANIERNLIAKGKFKVADGALYGVNIPQMIRSAKSKLKGRRGAKSSEEEKTDFTSLTGSFSMANGVVTNPDMAMASPLIRLNGKGSANLLSQTINYRLITSIVGSLKGQGGSDLDSLRGVDIPFAVTGTFSDPKFTLDVAALYDAKLKEKTKKETDKLKRKAKKETDKLQKKLFKKLGKF